MNDPTKEKIAEIIQEIADAKHMSKPNAKNMKAVYDANGRWLFEIYMVDHKIK